MVIGIPHRVQLGNESSHKTCSCVR